VGCLQGKARKGGASAAETTPAGRLKAYSLEMEFFKAKTNAPADIKAHSETKKTPSDAETKTKLVVDARDQSEGEDFVSPLSSPSLTPAASVKYGARGLLLANLGGQGLEYVDKDDDDDDDDEDDGNGGYDGEIVQDWDDCGDLVTPTRSVKSTQSGKSDASGLSLADIEQELHDIIAKVNAGSNYDVKRLDFLIALQRDHPEHQARQLEELREWTSSVEDYLAECLVAMRTFVPVNVACSSKDQIIAENPGLSVDVVRRIHEKKCLWLCRLSADDIDRLHDIELRDRYNPTAEILDVVELSGVYASFPVEFSSDPSGKKTELKLAVMQLLQRMLQQKADGELPAHKLRHPAYGSDEYGPIEDIVSTYSTRVVSGISTDEWKGLVAPRRSFQDVCGKHSILSMRKAEGTRKFANVFAEYSGPDLVHFGWLKKETGKVFSVFQSRYCVLTRSDKMLRYFKREDDTDTQGTCDLSTVDQIYPNTLSGAGASNRSLTGTPSPAKAPLVAGSNRRFQLVNTAGKTWTFEATSTEERDLWVEHIEYVVRASPESTRISISGSVPGKFNSRLSFGSNRSGGSPRQTTPK
jgi:hypothetical protein